MKELRCKKLLYLTYGTDVIELEQVKDQLWIPNLAERINKSDIINATSLEELNICGLTPYVEDFSNNTNEYHFKILPHSGGLIETVLYLNGIQLFKYSPEELKKIDGVYHITIKYYPSLFRTRKTK